MPASASSISDGETQSPETFSMSSLRPPVMIEAILVAQVFVAGREPLAAKALGRPIPGTEKRRAHLEPVAGIA